MTSDVQDKTIVITVTSRHTHPIYGKQYTVTVNYTCLRRENEAHVGDRVEVSESRPYSAIKDVEARRVLESGHASVELKDEEEVVAKKPTAKESEAA